MVLTFGVISNKVCYTLVCFYMLFFFFFFGYTMLLFVEDYLNYKDEEMKDHSLAWMEKTIKSSTVQYTRLLDFFTKKLKLCSWLQIKGVMNHTFVANFLFYFILFSFFYLK